MRTLRRRCTSSRQPPRSRRRTPSRAPPTPPRSSAPPAPRRSRSSPRPRSAATSTCARTRSSRSKRRSPLVAMRSSSRLRAIPPSALSTPARQTSSPRSTSSRPSDAVTARFFSSRAAIAAGTLYGAYRFAEHLGVRFYLHGDVIPDEPSHRSRSRTSTRRQSRSSTSAASSRSTISPRAPTGGTLDGYKAILGQLPKLRMNFFGLHTYPEGGVGPEPLTWIGQAAGRRRRRHGASSSYPSRHFTTRQRHLGLRAEEDRRLQLRRRRRSSTATTSAPTTCADQTPWPTSPEDSNELFNRMGAFLRDAFGFARRLGHQDLPRHRDAAHDPHAAQGAAEGAGQGPRRPDRRAGSSTRACSSASRARHPLDYYWFWTPEGWTWGGVSEPQIDGDLPGHRSRPSRAAKNVKAPVHAGHVRLGARAAQGPGAVRQGPAQGHAA